MNNVTLHCAGELAGREMWRKCREILRGCGEQFTDRWDEELWELEDEFIREGEKAFEARKLSMEVRVAEGAGGGDKDEGGLSKLGRLLKMVVT